MALILKVITWNISFGSMLANEEGMNDWTGLYLAGYCEYLNNTFNSNICLKNVQFILFPKEGDKMYDIIALQEASNWREIFDEENNKKKYNYITTSLLNTRGSLVPLTTFYNKQKLKLKSVQFGNLHNPNDVRPNDVRPNDVRPNDVRPYHVLVFESLEFYNTYFTFINLHNGHNKDLKIDNLINENNIVYNILDRFTESLHLIFNTNKENNIKIDLINMEIGGIKADNDSNIVTIGNKINNNNIIIVGDFNNIYNYLSIHGKEIKRTENRLKTCCTGSSSIRSRDINNDIKEGDMIMISNTEQRNKINVNIPQNFLNTIPNEIDIPKITKLMENIMIDRKKFDEDEDEDKNFVTEYKEKIVKNNFDDEELGSIKTQFKKLGRDERKKLFDKFFPNQRNLPIASSDHIPVEALIELNQEVKVGGYSCKRNKRKSNKGKSNKRKSNKRKSNKGKSNKRKSNKRKIELI
jgi:hypothetical protein